MKAWCGSYRFSFLNSRSCLF